VEEVDLARGDMIVRSLRTSTKAVARPVAGTRNTPAAIHAPENM